ncbi:MAG: hypothetical protein OXB86_06595 [Bdellovibrionales bacterium]|nr:hypothetical protein [Bdellovibrionales bacterium]
MDLKNKIFKRNYPFYGMVFLSKVGCIIFLTVVTLNCFAEKTEGKLSIREKRQEVRNSLYSLLGLLNEPQQRSEKDSGQTLQVEKNRLETLYNAAQNQADEEESTEEELEEAEFTEEEEDGEINKRTLNWQEVLAKERGTYVKTLFRKDKKLMERLKETPEPLFFAIQFGNLDLVRFFSEECELINKAREVSGFSPLVSSFLARWEDIILYFLDHPKTNLRQTNVWKDNIFHMVSLVEHHPPQRGKKVSSLGLLNVLFQPKYFLRIFRLLLAENSNGDTPLDLFLKENDITHKQKERIVVLLKRKMKLATQLRELSQVQGQLEALIRTLFKGDVSSLQIKGMSQIEVSQLIEELNAYEIRPLKNEKNQKKKAEGEKQVSEESMAEQERGPSNQEREPQSEEVKELRESIESNQGGEQIQSGDRNPQSLLCKKGFLSPLLPGEVLP